MRILLPNVRRLSVGLMLAAVSVGPLAGCSDAARQPPGSSGQTVGSTPAITGSPSGGPTSPSARPTSVFDDVDRAASALLNTRADWHRPRSFTVDRTDTVALTLGDSSEIRESVEKNVPKSTTVPAGTIAVGPDVKVTLLADPADASVTPSGEVNASTTRNVALYYQWAVKPKHPTSRLVLTAHVVVPLSGASHAITHDLTLVVPVANTWSHRGYQLFANWQTWTAVAGTAVLVYGWVRRKARQANGRAKRPAPHRKQRSHPKGT